MWQRLISFSKNLALLKTKVLRSEKPEFVFYLIRENERDEGQVLTLLYIFIFSGDEPDIQLTEDTSKLEELELDGVSAQEIEPNPELDPNPEKDDSIPEKMPILDSEKEGSEKSESPQPSSPARSSPPPLSPPPSSPPHSSPPPMAESPMLKMKDQQELMANPMDLLKNNPFLLPAQFLALNPSLYAAQLAQLQAAQIMLARQQHEALLGVQVNGEALGRKRSADEDLFESKQKLPRPSSPRDFDSGLKSEKPLDLSGSRSPELKPGNNYFNPLMPAGLLSFFNHLRPPTSMPHDFPQRKSPSHSPPTRTHTNPWHAQWSNKHNDNAKPEDVFKCVWCKESYQSLEGLTVHMKEAKHHSLPNYSSHGLGSPNSSHHSPIHSLPSPSKPRDVLRDQMPLPRKLVRGQDVWIGRADEQTRDILKCMGCGQSFRSLDLLTKHMQETQHYKKVISHDQISSWKYPESHQTSVKNHVSSVLTCKVCDKGFGTLKDLSDHMVRANHYTGDKMPRNIPSQAQLNKERKKALPVKKLLELERARQEVAGNFSPVSAREIMESGKLLCERCEEKIPIDIFIPHIQQCVGRPRFLKNTEPEPTIPTTGNKDGNCGSKSDMKENGSDGGNSILGSLELLVKGNFQGSARQVSSGPSPVPRFQPPQFSPENKFNISNLFPSRTSPGLSSTSGSTSKPDSPVPIRGTILADKLAGIEPGILKEEERMSPGSEKSRSSPVIKSEDERMDQIKVPTPLSSPEQGSGGGGGNPLAQLQMFCEDQKKSPKAGRRETSASPMSDPGAILAFSWACNQAVSADSVIKCPFCDTPFISKGAYRHHLSKMHFTKENLGGMTPGTGSVPANGPRTPSPDTKDAEESLQSKYHKYSQLAKQLSCCEGTN